MSKFINIKSSLGHYTIDIFAQHEIYPIEEEENTFYLIDNIVFNLYYASNFRRSNFLKMEATEKNKTLLFVMEVIEWLRMAGANSNSKLVVVGGGVVQDIGTIAASLFMRGIDWYLVPTTLLSMVDSCIGGKSAINVGAYKNIAGNFYPPSRVMIYPIFCNTLTVKHRLEGICEALKIFYVSDPNYFSDDSSALPSHWLDKNNNSALIRRSLSKKKDIIEADEFDNGERLLLNFGHTFGHAIETASDYLIPHGIAVGLGMILAVDYSNSTYASYNEVSLRRIVKSLLSYDTTLADAIEKIDLGRALQAFEADKKHALKTYRLIIPQGDRGSVRLVDVKKSTSSRNKIRRVFEGLKSLL